MSKKYEDALYASVIADIARDSKAIDEKAKKDQEFQALDWHSKQAVLFGYLPLERLKTSIDTEFMFLGLQIKAKNNDKLAQFDLGRCYAHGVFIAKDEHKAQSWFKKSSDLGYIPAKYALAASLQKSDPTSDPRVILKLLEEAAAGNYASAQNTLGMLYLRNQHVEPSYKNLIIALEWFQKARLLGEEKSVQGLKKCLRYFREYHIPYPKEVNLSFLEEAAVVAQGAYPFAYTPAEVLRDSKPEDKLHTIKTAGLLLKIAEAILEQSISKSKVNKDSKTQTEKKEVSAEIIKSAWKQMHEKSNKDVPPSPALENCLFDASRCFFYGFQVKEDHNIGIQYCKAANMLNFAPAQEFLATIYKKLAKKASLLEKQKRYYDEAYNLYTEAAYNGFSKGQCNLALFYEQGLCHKTPKAEVSALAFTWYMRAAHLGYELAQNAIARCITTRYGVPDDLCEIVTPIANSAAAASAGSAAGAPIVAVSATAAAAAITTTSSHSPVASNKKRKHN